MIPFQPIAPPLSRPSLPKARICAGENPLVHVILAFWALWHCRHARPPDTSLAHLTKPGHLSAD
ncbi:MULTISPECIES: hypothetical protein [Pseudomonas]|uniref:Uncharacterized protein n=1 Tax=Pseudomonas putida (strain W619) TaxID=390235 RepID=B1JCP6_PSEPW|nr:MULTISPECIES: hypothetical protein [Pseudomonas]MDH1573567.1 hypothetical protein [Pseudomonas sp. GD03746]UTL80013.1 hypothetical protein NL778_18765 [Pseudomonas putida]